MTSNPLRTTLASTMTSLTDGKSPEPPTGGLSLSVALIVLIVLGALCAVLGAIYSYIYFTRINPRSNRARKYIEQAAQDDDAGNQGTSTHLFLFRKS